MLVFRIENSMPKRRGNINQFLKTSKQLLRTSSKGVFICTNLASLICVALLLTKCGYAGNLMNTNYKVGILHDSDQFIVSEISHLATNFKFTFSPTSHEGSIKWLWLMIL
ncbi:unnamed protein product [Cuscuta epithymum]|uniref:Uncharacterized protein n=1 Tax=Cuscuta epithymum TaxID=186058 RepID=A0AAV0EVX4_9ASTE|nr:unnamed protein product [Cuscuta epithymum]